MTFEQDKKLLRLLSTIEEHLGSIAASLCQVKSALERPTTSPQQQNSQATESRQGDQTERGKEPEK